MNSNSTNYWNSFIEGSLATGRFFEKNIPSQMRIPTEPWCKNRIGTMWFALEYSYRSTSFYKLHLPGKSTTALDAMNLPWVILYPAREDAGNIILKTNLEITQNLLISFLVTNVSSPIASLNMRGSSKKTLSSHQPPKQSTQLHQRRMQARS